MSTKTLLDVVQDVLAQMASDPVNSISDTYEATQIARLVRTVFNNIVTEQDLQVTQDLFTLNGLGDTTKPTVLGVPNNVVSIKTFKYDTSSSGRTRYSNLTYREPADFLRVSYLLNSTDSTVDTITLNNVKFYVQNNKAPEYWTMFDDDNVVCDSYNSTVESTLVGNKTSCWGDLKPTLDLQDSSIIPLNDSQIPQLVNETASLAFELYKGGATPKIEQLAQRSRVRAQRLRHRARLDGGEARLGVNYGRKS